MSMEPPARIAEMTREALDIILKLWASDEPFEYRGEYWTVNRIDPMLRR